MKTSTPPQSLRNPRTARRSVRTRPNEYGGIDFAGKSGNARTAVDDAGNTTIYAFTLNLTLRWTVEVGALAPRSLVDAAWDLAVTEAMA